MSVAQELGVIPTEAESLTESQERRQLKRAQLKPLSSQGDYVHPKAILSDGQHQRLHTAGEIEFNEIVQPRH